MKIEANKSSQNLEMSIGQTVTFFIPQPHFQISYPLRKCLGTFRLQVQTISKAISKKESSLEAKNETERRK